MNCNTLGNLQSMNAICLERHPADDKTINGNESAMMQAAGNTEDVNLAAASAFVANNYATPGIDTKTAADAGSQSKSLFFSEEASSIFDKALEMHAAPTNDPPMWGDDFGDMMEVADMLEDIGDFSTGNEAVGQRDFYSTPNVYAASKKEPFECFLGVTGVDAHDSLAVKLNGEESKSGNNDVSRASGSKTAALNEVADLPVHMNIMNMDKRIFEDSMLIGDIAQDESDNMDSFSGTFFWNDGPDMLDRNGGSPETAAHAENLQYHMSARAFPFEKQESLDSPAPWPSPLQPTALLPIVSPRQLNSTRFSEVVTGKSMAQMSMVAPQPQLKANTSLGYPGDCSSLKQGRSTNSGNCNNGLEAAATGNYSLLKHQENHDFKGISKSDAAWKRRYVELEVFKRQYGHFNVPQKFEKNPSLGAWVARQRLIMRQWEDQHEDERTCIDTDGTSLPTGERVQRLKNIGLESSIGKGAFGKLCSRNTDEWEKQFSDLLKYCEKNGDCNVPTKCTSLGRWVSSQRKKYRLFLADEGRDQHQAFGWSKELRSRFKRLKDIGFNFYLGKGNAQQKKSI